MIEDGSTVWPTGFIEQFQPSIEFLELFVLVSALITWNQEQKLNDRKITIFCDNEAVVHIVNNLA